MRGVIYSLWKSDLLFQRKICSFKEWLASNSFFSPYFSPFYAQNKRVNRSSSLFVKDDIRSRHSLQKKQRERFALWKEQIALLLSKSDWFARKTKEQIPNPAFREKMWKDDFSINVFIKRLFRFKNVKIRFFEKGCVIKKTLKSNESNSHFEKSKLHFRSQKTIDSHEKQKSEIPTLLLEKRCEQMTFR